MAVAAFVPEGFRHVDVLRIVVRSKMPVAQMNEVLCKVICHNLCVLVQSIYELDIAPTFWEAPPAPNPAPSGAHLG
jgi:hypothetical protein